MGSRARQQAGGCSLSSMLTGPSPRSRRYWGSVWPALADGVPSKTSLTGFARLQPQDAGPTVHLSADDCGVSGLSLILDFVSEEEERELLRWQQGERGWEVHAGRRVKHYGFRFDYVTRNIDRNSPLGKLPECVEGVASRIQSASACPQLDQLTINSYPPGVGLLPHVDTHSAFTGAIISLSLGAAATMEFRREGVKSRLLLPQRSLLVMDGEARYCWQHYIPHCRLPGVTADRISFTFRTARGFACDCSYPQYCDSQQGSQPPTRLALGLQGQVAQNDGTLDPVPQPQVEETRVARECCASGSEDSAAFRVAPARRELVDAGCQDLQHKINGTSGTEKEICCMSDRHLLRLEEEYVHKVYDVIARHFSSTRFAVWPKVRGFLEALPAAVCVADVGCGNGKYFNVRNDVVVVGLDRSRGLLEAAAQRLQPVGLPSRWCQGYDLLTGDCLRLPLRSDTFEAVLCIAVLHHVSSRSRRVACLREIVRVLVEGGQALVTVWAQEQENEEKTVKKWKPIQEHGNCGGDYLVPWHLPMHRPETGALAACASGDPGGSAEGTTAECHSQPPIGGLNSLDVGAGSNDGRIHSAKRSVVFDRYYHLYVKGELEELCTQVEGCIVREAFYDHSNWGVVLEKQASRL
eukprot:evm.model.scf_27.9 EVM.evm.TU.scf_27.9   scf_27:65880-70787(-)